MFSVLYGLFLRPLPVEHPERLVSVQEVSQAGFEPYTSYLTFTDWRNGSRTFFEDVAAVTTRGFDMVDRGLA